MAADAEIIRPQTESHELAAVAPSPTICVSICCSWPDADLLNLLHSLSRQSYSTDLISISVTFLGNDVRIMRELQSIQSTYEGRFRSFETSYTRSLSQGAAHNRALSRSNADLLLTTNQKIVFPPKSVEALVAESMLSQNNIAAWEMRSLDPNLRNGHLIEDNDSSICILYRRKIVERLGGFSEADAAPAMAVEFAYRLRDSGYRIVQSTAAYTDNRSSGGRVPDEGYKSRLSALFCSIRYGDAGQRFSALAELVYMSVFGVAVNERKLARLALGRPVGLINHTLRDRVSMDELPLCGWHNDFIASAKTQSAFVSDYGKHAPLVSLVVCTAGDHEGQLSECLRTIANQTYPNLEVIVVEAGAAGSARRVLRKGLFGPGIRVVSLQDSGGYHPARLANTGSHAAHGEYLGILFDDQLLFDDHVERCIAALLRDRDLDAAFGSSRMIETELVSDQPLRYREFGRRRAGRAAIEQIADDDEQVLSAAVLTKRATFVKLGGLDESLSGLAFWSFFRQLARTGAVTQLKRITAVGRLPAPGPAREAYDRARKALRDEVLDLEKGKMSPRFKAPSFLPDFTGN